MDTTPQVIAASIFDLAMNLWWAWTPEARSFFARVAPIGATNPVAALAEVACKDGDSSALDGLHDPTDVVDIDKLAAALEAGGLVEDAERLLREFESVMRSPSTWASSTPRVRDAFSDGVTAYFSAEYGLDTVLPIYCGGLGVLSGDHVKASSDLGLPFVAIGLLYHEGYFTQRLSADGVQSDAYNTLDTGRVPLRLERYADGTPVTISVDCGEGVIKAAIRRADVGRTPLFLLDTWLAENSPAIRELTGRLYGGDNTTRIRQELLLGVGGVRALRTLGYDPSVYHLNEGHCAFVPLELARERILEGAGLDEALNATRATCVFTTHTPVPAGHDRFDTALVDEELGWMVSALGTTLEGLMDLGRDDAVMGDALSLPEPGETGGDEVEVIVEDVLVDDLNEDEELEDDGDDTIETAALDMFKTGLSIAAGAVTALTETIEEAIGGDEDEDAEAEVAPDEPLTMTVLALRLSCLANGVSLLHGEVSRQMWSGLWPDRAGSDVPIGHVTNGIHLPTWMAPAAREVFETHIGERWIDNRDDADMWLEAAWSIPDEALWEMRLALKARFVSFVKARTAQTQSRWPGGGEGIDLDPEALTIGFARRFATYKRAKLIFHLLEEARALFADTGRPIQIIFAGKAHPKDEGGQALIRDLFTVAKEEPFLGKVVVLEDYDINTGQHLVSGVDVWLNNPRRPREASGTSGQKVTVHGGLNCSILDGWWVEGYSGTNGFAIGDATAPCAPEAQDTRDARSLVEVLDKEVLAAYFDRDEAGIPRRWLRRVRIALATSTARFSAYRMVKDYARAFYATAVEARADGDT